MTYTEIIMQLLQKLHVCREDVKMSPYNIDVSLSHDDGFWARAIRIMSLKNDYSGHNKINDCDGKLYLVAMHKNLEMHVDFNDPDSLQQFAGFFIEAKK